MDIQYWFELLGVAFFAISGALSVSEKKEMDWFGAAFIGFVTALGGGSMRDVLLGSYPIAWIKDVNLVYVIFIALIIARVFSKPLLKLRKTFFLFDTLGIALFTVVGTSKALSLGVGNINAAAMGMFTAVFGGVIRDILTNEIPIIFRKEIYATACLAGAGVYVILHHLDLNHNLNLLIAGSIIILIRLFAVKRNWHLPKYLENH